MLIGLVLCFVSTGAGLISYETQHTFGASIHDVMTPANITIEKIADAGGKGNNGFLARVESGAPHFYALPPFGGTPCNIRTNTSVTASKNIPKCRLATNGGPFDMRTGGCQGVLYHHGEALLRNWSDPNRAVFGLTNNSNWILGNMDSKEAAKIGVIEALTGFACLVRNGKVSPCVAEPKFCNEVAPRTAIGVDADGRLLMLVVDGCEKCIIGDQGLTLKDTAELLLAHGAKHAVNLDGGGSTAMYYNGSIADRPTCSDNLTPVCERAVTTVVCVGS
jgi:N-acetylglucosamine-1-phosphodiester alpha-N-acetylglucosaminidase